MACGIVFAAVFLSMPGGRRAIGLVKERLTWRFRDLPAIVGRAQDRLRAAGGEDLAFPLPGARIAVHKRDRRADLFSGGRLIKSYRVALGGAPDGPKLRKGDERTPEGAFHICTRLQRSSYHLFLGLNYPQARDAERGLNAGLVDEQQGRRIADAEHDRNAPDWTTRLGGAIGLHGGGTDSDWTDGCIAFDNADIEEIWAATDYWSTVEIAP